MAILNHSARILLVMLLLSGCATSTSRLYINSCSVVEGDILNNEGTGKGKVIIGGACQPYDSITATYEGDFINSEPYGTGKMTWPDGRSYEGDWLNGVRTGQGKFIWADGNVYEGEFLNNLLSGQGKEVYANGDFYEGGYLNNNRVGQGKSKWTYPKGYPKGIVFNSDWVFASGIYEGTMLNNQLHGWGRYSYETGEIWEGQVSVGSPVPASGRFK